MYFNGNIILQLLNINVLIKKKIKDNLNIIEILIILHNNINIIDKCLHTIDYKNIHYKLKILND